MELAQRGAVDMEDVSDREEEPQEEEAKLEVGVEARTARALLGACSKPRSEVPMYEGNLNV